MNLETIQCMWEKDSQLDKDNLHDESLKIPSLHAKYHELFNNTLLLMKKAEQQRKNSEQSAKFSQHPETVLSVPAFIFE